MLRVVEKPTKENEELRTTLDEFLQRGALKILHEALESEAAEYVRRHVFEESSGRRQTGQFCSAVRAESNLIPRR